MLYNEYISYRALVGSRAYGLDHAESDEDWRGWYIAPTRDILSMKAPPEQLQESDSDETYWEVGKFFKLLLDNNPNVLETMYSPQVEFPYEPMAEFARLVVGYRQRFLSRRIIQTYGGYAIAQKQRGLKYLENPDMNKQGWKHLMHLCRLLICGIHALRNKEVLVHVRNHRDNLLSIRRGEWSMEQFDGWYNDLEKEFQKAKAETELPELPDYDLANDLLWQARQIMLPNKEAESKARK